MAMLLGALLAVPALLALYLLRLRRRPLRVSHVLFWPVAGRDVQANIPLAPLRPSWLLLLHAAILALLLLALGRPALRGAPAGTRLVLLLDASASMSARAEPRGPTRLDLARGRAKALLAEALRGSGGARVAVLSFAAEPAILANFTDSRAALDAAVGAAEPTDQPADLRSAFALLGALAADAESADPGAGVAAVVLTDGNLSLPADAPVAGAAVRWELVRREPGPPPANLGVASFAARRDPRDPALLRVFAQIVNSGPAPTATSATLSLNGRVLDRRALSLPPRETGDPPRPGAATLSLDLPAPEGGVLLLTLPGGDALAADDAAALVLPGSAPPAVVLVTPEGSAGPWPVGTLLLTDVLRELRTRSLEHLAPAEYEARVIESRLAADLVVFDRVTPTRAPACPSLSLGAAWPGMPAKADPGPGVRAVFWDRSDPLLRYVTLDSLAVSRTIALEPPSGWRVIAQAAGGPLILRGEPGGVPRAVVAFDVSDSNWPVQAGFPVFIAAAADALTRRGEAAAGVAFRTGEPVSLRVGRAGELPLAGPFPVTLRAPAGDTTARGGPIQRAGVYTAPAATRPPEDPDQTPPALAVNLADAFESSLEAAPSLTISGGPASRGAAGPARREVWHWCILAAGVLLLVEWIVYARAVRV
jgi:hypothetical protein